MLRLCNGLDQGVFARHFVLMPKKFEQPDVQDEFI